MAAMNTYQQNLTLKQLLENVNVAGYLPDIEITGVTLDSRKIEPGYVFVAMEGRLDHGLVYAEMAVEKGAVAILCDADFDQYCQQILGKLMTHVLCVPVKNLHRKLADIAANIYSYQTNSLFLTGITGTDGKTTVSHFVAQAMNIENSSAAVIGTLGNGPVGNMAQSTHTTPDVISLYQMISEYQEQGVTSVSMEVSSHGLDQNRVSGVKFDVAVLTNLTRDHLDYHGSVEAYRDAKRKLFGAQAAKSLVLNIDDEFGQEIYDQRDGRRTIWLYGFDKAKAMQSDNYAYAELIKLNETGISFVLQSSQGEASVKLSLMGEFNVYNALACFCVLLQSGMSFNQAVKRLENLKTVSGRMEMLTVKDKPAVVIDYAHTPEALTQALENVRKHTSGKLICVFGCGGDRDAGKRPLMAKAADTYSDLVIVTDDNPRNEDPDNIIDEIKTGIDTSVNLIVERDREKAIQQAIEMASADDLILIAGKGHEEYQIIGQNKISFSDKKTAMKYLEGHA